MSCETCTALRLAYVEAMIALDVKRVADLTAQAVQHVLKPVPK